MDLNIVKKVLEIAKKDKKKILSKASEFFKKKGVMSRTSFKEGTPHMLSSMLHMKKRLI